VASGLAAEFWDYAPIAPNIESMRGTASLKFPQLALGSVLAVKPVKKRLSGIGLSDAFEPHCESYCPESVPVGT